MAQGNNPFYVEPGNNFLPGLNSLAGSLQNFKKFQDLQEEKEQADYEERRLKDLRTSLVDAYNFGDAEKMREIGLRNPELKDSVEQVLKFRNDKTRKNYLDSAMMLRADPTEENAEKVMKNRQQVLIDEGALYTDETDSFLEKFKENPEKAMRNVDMIVASIANKDEWERYKDVTGIGSKDGKPLTTMGKINKDFINGIITREEYDALRDKAISSKDYAPTNLKKLIEERQALLDTGVPKEDERIKAYDHKISGIDVEIEDLTPEAISMYGYLLNKTGKMISLGRGKEATAARIKIANAGATWGLVENLQNQGLEVPPELIKKIGSIDSLKAAKDIIESQVNLKATQGALNFLEKQRSSMGSFVKNMDDQIAAVEDIGKELAMTDVALLNKPWRELKRYLGSANQQKYDLFLGEITRENSKLATGSTQSIAAPAVEETKFWDKIHDKNLPFNDMLELLKATKQAGQIRYRSVLEQIDAARERINQPAGTREIGGDSSSAIKQVEGFPKPNQKAIDYLKNNPDDRTKAMFEKQFGYLPEGY